MNEEAIAQNVSSESVPPSVVKEAEVKLKEMSRKAKERQHEATGRKTQSAPPSPGKSNVNLFLVGGLGVSLLGILYLILRKPKEEWVFTPVEKSPEKPVRKEEEHTEPRKMTKPDLELNSF